jgi:hypothetical protein
MNLRPINPILKAVLYALAEMRLGRRARNRYLTLTYQGYELL